MAAVVTVYFEQIVDTVKHLICVLWFVVNI